MSGICNDYDNYTLYSWKSILATPSEEIAREERG
jgi:hypothetical protein